MNIIYTEPTTVCSHANIINVSIWLVAIIMFIVIGLFLNAYTENIIFSCIGAIMSVLGLAFFIVGFFYFIYETPGPNNYGVVLSEDYSFEELKENYDILEQKGLLYIVKEKEED